MTDTEIQQLINHARAGKDRRIQEAIFRACYGYGLTVARSYASDGIEAREILQDSYVKLFREIERQEITEWKPWFRRVIINTAIDYYRRKQRDWKIRELKINRPVVLNAAVEELNQEDLLRLLQLLTPAYRLAFNLHVLEGFSHPEIARRLGISVGTSKSNLSKARAKLREIAPAYFSLENKIKHG